MDLKVFIVSWEGSEGVHNGNSSNQRRDIYKMRWSVKKKCFQGGQYLGSFITRETTVKHQGYSYVNVLT